MTSLRLVFTILVLLFLVRPHVADADRSEQGFSSVREFQPDGCSLFPEGTPGRPDLWAHCCLEHDLHYWAGGTTRQRLHADQSLRQCFRDVGQEGLAEVVYLAVRAGRFYPLRFRSQQWGNAWSVKRNYRTHSDLEILQILETLDAYELPIEMKSRLERSLVESRSDN